jgi:uncharacterized protein (DUF1697 family)
MDDLRTALENAGMENVKTYLQSGNLIFKTKTSKTAVLEEKIVKILQQNFGLDIPTLVLTTQELQTVVEQNVFVRDSKKDAAFLHVTFLTVAPPTSVDLSGIEQKKTTNEAFLLSGRALYLYCPDGYGKTKLSNNFIEKTLGIQATTRNWKSVNEILSLAQTL